MNEVIKNIIKRGEKINTEFKEAKTNYLKVYLKQCVHF